MADKDYTPSETAMLLVAGEGCLYGGGCGQCLNHLSDDPVARANRPTQRDRVDTAHLSRYDGTDYVQWVGRKSDGRFWPIGKIMKLTGAGKASLNCRCATPREKHDGK